MSNMDTTPVSLPRKHARVYPIDVEMPASTPFQSPEQHEQQHKRHAGSAFQPSLAANVAQSVPPAFPFAAAQRPASPFILRSAAPTTPTRTAPIPSTGFQFVPPSGSVEFNIGVSQHSSHSSSIVQPRHSSHSHATQSYCDTSAPSTPKRGPTTGLAQRSPSHTPQDEEGGFDHFPATDTVRSHGGGALPKLLALVLLLTLSCAAFWMRDSSYFFTSSAALPTQSMVHFSRPPLPVPLRSHGRSLEDLDVEELVDTNQGRSPAETKNVAAIAAVPYTHAFHLQVRILSSGSNHHLELQRLLTSLSDASYSLVRGQKVDVEIVVDFPRGLILPTIPSADSGASVNETRLAMQRLHTTLASHEYMDQKMEHALTLSVAKEFRWDHGHVRVEEVEPSNVESIGGVFNAFVEPDGFSHTSSSNHWVLTLGESNVLSPRWFDTVGQIVGKVQDGSIDASNLFGAVLEPSEFVLGVVEGGKFDPGLKPDVIVSKHLSSAVESNSTKPTSLVYMSQQISSLGGLLLPLSRYAEFKTHLETQGLLRPDALSRTSTGKLRKVYSQQNLAQDPCVPGLVSDAWVVGDLLNPDESSLEAERINRMYNPWFLLGLLNRFVYERHLFLANIFVPSGRSFVSSSAFSIPHVHLESNDTKTKKDVVDQSSNHPDLLVLPPLKRELVTVDDTSAVNMKFIPQYFDFTFTPISNLTLFRSIPVLDLQSSCTPVLGGPLVPPQKTAPQELLDRIRMEMQKRHELTVEKGLLVDSTPDPSLAALPPTDQKFNDTLLDEEGLLLLANRTMESWKPNITLCSYESGSKANTDSQGFPVLDFAAGTNFLTDPELLFENTTDFQTKCWEDYEADWQMAILKPELNEAQIAAQKQAHARTKEALEGSIRSILAEVARRELFDRLSVQLALATDLAQEKRDAELVAQWEARMEGQPKSEEKQLAEETSSPLTPADIEAKEKRHAELDAILLPKRRTSSDAVLESAPEYERLLELIRERKARKQHEPLYLG
jgi:hypothetical protein